MISVIICSVDHEQYNVLCENIRSTIGVEHEIIRIDNSKNTFGICAAYNVGALKAKFELLCFVHEDVAFLTSKWGEILLNHFEDTEIGLLGIAGAQYKTRTIGGWWTPGDLSKIKLIQGNKNKLSSSQEINKDISGCMSCVCVDGVFMVTPRKVWELIRFDEVLLNKFHCYDLDYSLAVFDKGYKVIVCYDIYLEHFSQGGYDKIWYEETLKFHRKWQEKLPIGIDGISEKDKIAAEWEIKKNITRFLVSINYPLSTILKNIFGKMYKFSFKLCLICILEIYKARKGK